MMSKPGHNSGKGGPISAERLKSFIERIEKLEEERKAIGGDIRDVYAEAKGVGYDVGTMRKVVRLRAMDAADRAEQETLLDVYWHALQTVDRIDARLAAGESQREIAAAEGVSKSTVQRRGPKVESAPVLSKMDHPKPQDGEERTTHAMQASDSAPQGSPMPVAPKAGEVTSLAGPPVPEGGIGAGTNSDGDDGITESRSPEFSTSDSVVTSQVTEPVVPTGNEGRAGERDTVAFEKELERVYGPDDEAPAAPSVGAVASESERVATPFLGDDPGDPPPFLRRGRGA